MVNWKEERKVFFLGEGGFLFFFGGGGGFLFFFLGGGVFCFFFLGGGCFWFFLLVFVGSCLGGSPWLVFVRSFWYLSLQWLGLLVLFVAHCPRGTHVTMKNPVFRYQTTRVFDGFRCPRSHVFDGWNDLKSLWLAFFLIFILVYFHLCSFLPNSFVEACPLDRKLSFVRDSDLEGLNTLSQNSLHLPRAPKTIKNPVFGT